ncbi:MAG: FAD-linked oxidase C-terminal domain-containing protein [Pseudomonadota bacterium]
MTDTNREEVRTLLRACLPQACLIEDEAGKRPYECDGLTAIREQPWLVAMPENETQVAAVLKICRRHNVPVVPRGAGTGLSGGARPISDGVVLSLAKMNQILEIDPLNCVARLQPGVRNLAISEAASQFGLYYAPDPSSQIACSIGGNVAENSGGVHCLKYGLTVHNVLGVRVLLSDGELLEIGGAIDETPGLDLLALICGSEGMLGVVTEITVALLPKPPAVAVMLAAFDDVEVAASAVADVISAGIIPAGMEMMDKPAVSAAEAFAHAGYPLDAEAILLVELDGTPEEVVSVRDAVTDLFNKAGATSIDVAMDAESQMRLWKGRKSAFPAVGRLAPDYYCMDGTIPRRRLADVLRRINELSEEYDLPVANVFHAGDGNLHPLILFDANIPGQLEATEEMGGKILELCVQMGGTVTGEHGVGIEKLNQMCVQFSKPELEQFFRIKHSWDPPGILNPGKGIPTLTRCGELGGMHVRSGHEPHPDLERF